MNTKDILYHLRTEKDLSQDELAAKFCYPTGGIPLGNRRNHAECRNAQAAFRVL
nr:hypothetical protein [Butyricicoccus sp. OF13-6]